MTLSDRSASACTMLGAFFVSADELTCDQMRRTKRRSRSRSSAVAPAAAVRTMTPPSSTSSAFASLRSRSRSPSGRRRLTPEPASPLGESTRKRPAMESSIVTRGPFVPIESLTTWTSTSWPGFRTSSILRRRRVRDDVVPGNDHVVHVQEAVSRQSEVDERRLHPAQHVVDLRLVDVAHQRPLAAALDQRLDRSTLLDHGDA